MDILTQSELSTFARCERKWWLSYYRKLRRRKVYEPLPAVGTFVHAGLEALYGPGDERHPIDVVRDKATAEIAALPEFADEIADAAGLAGIMLEGYLEWLQAENPDAGLHFTAAEQAVEVALGGHPFRLRGKIDAIFTRDRDGAVVQLENKTVANLTDLPKTAQANFQFLTYDLLAYLRSQEDTGTPRTDGVLLNMLRRVKRTARANPPFYGRHEVRHNLPELRNHWRHVVVLAYRKREAAEKLAAGQDHHVVTPKNWTRDCTWSCDFYPVCPLFDDGSDVESVIAADYETHDPNARYAGGEEDN